MIKKLLIALIALSFLVGNLVFADNPGDLLVSDQAVRVGAQQIPPLKPTAVDCGFQDFTCEAWAYVVPFSNDAGYGLGSVGMRFSPTTVEQCYVNEVAFLVYDFYASPADYPTGDLRVSVYGEVQPDGDLPDPGSLIFTVDVPFADIALSNFTYVPIPGGANFNIGEDVFVVLEPTNATDVWWILGEDDLTTCSTPGTCTTDEQWRAVAFFKSIPGYSWLASCGGSEFLNMVIFADICCEQPSYTCPGNQEWPTFQQNDGRTGYTTNTIGDLTNFRKLWEHQVDYFITWGHPVIADEKVFIAYYDGVVALDLYTGTEIWNTFTHPDYAAFMHATTNNLRVTPTYDNGYVYFGTGKRTLDEGFVCADANTGDTIWVRHQVLGSGLPGGIGGLTGEVQYTSSVVANGNVYFGTSFGEFYALNALTGTDVWNVTLDNGIWLSPSSDGTDIFVGTSDGYVFAAPAVGGSVYKLDGATGATLYTYAGFDTYAEGFVTAPVYDANEGVLFINGNTGVGLGSSGYNEGILHARSAADLTDVWGGAFLTMNPYFVNPTAAPFPWERVTVGGSHSSFWFFYGSTANASFKQFSYGGSLTWVGDVFDLYVPSGGGPYWETSSCSYAVTCDPYIFAGFTINDTWRIFDHQTGDELLKYKFSDDVLGTAIAEYADHDYVIVTTFASAYGNGYGKVFCFDIGPDRPRLYVPDPIVTLGAVSFVDSYPQSRFGDMFANIGSAAMTWDMEIVTAKSNNINQPSNLAKVATDVKKGLLSPETVALLDNRALTPSVEKNTDQGTTSLAADFVRFPGGVTTVSGVLPAASVHNQEFVLDPALMNRGTNPFEVLIDADDPDYNPEVEETYPHTDPLASVTVVAVKGYAFCDDYISMGTGTNTAYVTNAGWNSTGGPSDAFMIDDFTDFLYHHSFFYGYEDDHMVWVEESGSGYNHFEPNSECVIDPISEDIYNATGLDRTVTGEVFSASFIDSLKDQATGQFDAANTPGLEMFIKEYGVFDDDFANFKYVYVEIANRGSDPLPADLYWGTWSDWDVANFGANVGKGLIGNGASAYRMYDDGNQNFQYGMGFVPMAGNLFTDNTPTVGAYGTYQIANDPVVYDNIIIDSFFNYVDDCPPYTDCYYPGTEVGTNPGQDMSAILVADKQFVDGDEVLRGGLVMFGLTGAAVPDDEVADLMNFANKFAGFGRGDVNNDNVVDLLDLCVLNCYVAGCGCSPYPFLYLGDVNVDGQIDADDVQYLYDYLFMGGPLPKGDFIVR